MNDGSERSGRGPGRRGGTRAAAGTTRTLADFVTAPLCALLALPLLAALACGAAPANAAGPTAAAGGGATPAQSATSGDVSLLAPPRTDGPVVVHARFEFHDVNEINDTAETFEFTGALTLVWKDPRQAFDPAVVGVPEKVFQGDYQFNELATGWYPQVVLVNRSGAYDKSGVVLRIAPDGTSTLIESLDAAAEVDFDMMRFPIDEQRLGAVFEVLGFDRDEVRLEVDPAAARSNTAIPPGGIQIPQWIVTGSELTSRERAAAYAGRTGVASVFVATVDVKRDSFFINRLVLFPLVVIVLLSFSVFWMDRASLGDRISVSFIGILTGVAYQMVMSESMPRIAYVTLMNGLLNLSFLFMCATVVVNLLVGSLDKRGQHARGDRIDHVCRWIFPIAYFLLIGIMVVVARFFV